MKTTPSIFYSNKPRWQDYRVFMEDDMTETLLESVKKAHKLYIYFQNKGIHKASQEFLAQKIVKELEKLQDVHTIDFLKKSVEVNFTNSLTSVVIIANRKKISKLQTLTQEIRKVQFLLQNDTKSTKIGYVTFFVLQKHNSKKKLQKNLDKQMQKIQAFFSDITIFYFCKYFKYFKKNTKNNKKKFRGYYSAVTVKIQIKEHPF
jgi:hypothetical protein